MEGLRGLTIESVQARTGITITTLRKELKDLPQLASVADGRWLHRDAIADFRRRSMEFLDGYFKTNKMAMNVPKRRVRAEAAAARR